MSGHNWSMEDVCKLIEMFKEREVLWNTDSVDYKNRHKKHDSWTEIANEFNLDKRVIEIKIRSLVGQFNRECKYKYGPDARGPSKWFAFKKLMFLKPRNVQSSTVDGESQSNVEDSSDPESTPSVNERPVKKDFASPRPFLKRRIPRERDDITQRQTFKMLKNICETRKAARDEIDAFGEYVTMKLRQLENSYARNTAQHHINNILYNAAMGHYDGPIKVRGSIDPIAGPSWEYNSIPSPSAVSESNVATSATFIRKQSFG